MDIDPTLKLALSLYQNPGVYVLLLGSGVSRAAGILTGWEITLDLIRKVAVMSKEDPELEPEKWYSSKFNQSPDYSKLLEQLANTQTERYGILHSYFEPTQEDREKGIKIPTQTHNTIAKLVQDDFIKVILTTNFDRLLENSLESIGVIPDMVSSDDSLQGAIPYVHSKIYIVKLHGDYRDTRIRNTKEELTNYSQELNAFLDRVFDEFGLIICGWSGEWDIALRNAILRCPNRRFTTFWLVKDEISKSTKEIIDHRKAEIIQIESADKFFNELIEKIESLKELGKQEPHSTEIAVATVKRYIVDPIHRIRLRDLMHEEVEKVYEKIISGTPESSGSHFGEQFQSMMKYYENLTERLIQMLIALSFYDEGKNSDLLTNCIERLLQLPREKTFHLLFYPAIMVLYNLGVAAVAGKKFKNLSMSLINPMYLTGSHGKNIHAVEEIAKYSGKISEHIGNMFAEYQRHYAPFSGYLFTKIKPNFKEYLPEDIKYEWTFDVFEYLLSITVMDLTNGSWGPVGRFGWNYNREKYNPIEEFIKNGQKKGNDWELLKAGFFGGSIERFTEIIKRHDEFLQKATKNWY